MQSVLLLLSQVTHRRTWGAGAVVVATGSTGCTYVYHIFSHSTPILFRYNEAFGPWFRNGRKVANPVPEGVPSHKPARRQTEIDIFMVRSG